MDPSTGYIKYANGYNTSGQRTTVYKHLSETKYGEQNGRMRYKYILDPKTSVVKQKNAYQHGKEITNITVIKMELSMMMQMTVI